MKKIFLPILVLSVSGLAASCVGLDTAPYDRETDLTFWSEDPDAALDGVNTCYEYIASMDELMFSEGMTDNAYVKMPSGYTQSIGNGSYSTADSYVKSVWDFRYAGVRVCNELLANIDKVPGLSAELKARYIAEAKVIRAYIYYELYTRFGDIPYTEDVISVGGSASIARTPKAEVVSRILADLDEVISSKALPESYSGADRGRITHWAAVAVAAKVQLFEGNWAEVKNLTSDIMSNGGFSLFPSYSGLFEIANEYNSEVIMDVQYKPSSREHQIIYNIVPPSIGGYSLMAPLQELVDSYVMLNGKAISETGSGYDESNPYADRDPRLKATIIYTGNSYVLPDGSEAVINCDKGSGRDAFGGESDSTPTGYYVKKWWDNTYRANFYSGLNPIVIRYADILLMNAEANVETGTMNAGVWNSTVREIRRRAGFSSASALDFPSSASQADLRNIVRGERRSEFAFEGLRFKDIVRWRTAETVLNGWCHGLKTSETVGTDNGYVRVENRTFNPAKHYLWPIPQAERDLNRNLTQNPEW